MKTFTFYEQTIIDCIDFEGYGVSNDCYLYDKIKTVYNIFLKEYGHEIKRQGSEVKAFKEWLQELPSVLTAPFYYHEILENAKQSGFNLTTEEQEDKFLSDYWSNLSKAFFTLKDNL